MKRIPFTALFIGSNIVFVALYIYKHNLLAEQLVLLKKNENLAAHLTQQKLTLAEQYNSITDPEHIKEFAQHTLKMSQVKANSVKKLNAS